MSRTGNLPARSFIALSLRIKVFDAVVKKFQEAAHGSEQLARYSRSARQTLRLSQLLLYELFIPVLLRVLADIAPRVAACRRSVPSSVLISQPRIRSFPN